MGKGVHLVCFVSPRFLNENNIRFLPTPGASFQDTSFSFKAFSQAERFACSSRAFVHYRQDNEKSSVNNPGKVFCVCDEHAEIERFLTEDRPDLKPELNMIRAKMKFYNYQWNLHRLANPLKLEFLARYSEEFRNEFKMDSVIALDEGRVLVMLSIKRNTKMRMISHSILIILVLSLLAMILERLEH